MSIKRSFSISGLLLCLLVGGWLRLVGFDWGYDRNPDTPLDSQGGYIHPDERGIYSKAAGLRWDDVPAQPDEPFLDWQLRALKRRFLHKDSGMNIDSFNYGSMPYYALMFLSWLGNTYSASAARWAAFEALVFLFLLRMVWLLARRKIKGGTESLSRKFKLEATGCVVLYAVFFYLSGLFFQPFDNFRWHYGSWGFLGRPLSAICGTLTILYVYKIGARAYNRKTGLLSAILLTFAVLHIQLSHFFTFDVILAFFTTAAVYYLLVLVDAETWGARWRNGFIASFLAGMGLATKFGAILYFVPWGFAILWVFWVKRPKVSVWKPATIGFVSHLGLLAVFSFLVFWFSAFIGQPFAFLNYPDKPDEPELSFVHLDLYDRPGLPTSPLRSSIAGALQRLNPLTAPLGFHFSPHYHPDSRRPFDSRLTIGSAKHWKDVDEQRLMATSGGGVPWTRQYNHTTPFIYQWKNLIYYALGPPLGILCLLGLFWGFGKPFYRPTAAEWLLWLWMAPNFFPTMLFHTKFPRYLIGQIPFFCIWAAALLIWAYILLERRWERMNGAGWRWHWIIAWATVAGVAWTMLYAQAFVAIYTEDHTWTQCSKWFEQSIPEGRKIITEQWDDSVPWDGRVAGRYQMRTTQPVHSDEVSNMKEIARSMAWTDLYCFSSKRNYGAFLQSPESAPNRIKFVKSLFAGNLGFKLHKTFSRPISVLGIPIKFELADESLSLYDHPTVHIFQDNENLPAEEIYSRMATPPLWVNELTTEQILTHTENRSIFTPTPDYATASWLAGLILLGWLVWPISFCLFRACRDGGLFASKMLALILLSYGAWFGASVGWWNNSRWATTFVFLLIGSISFFIWRRIRGNLYEYLRANWKLAVFSEVIFLLVFAWFFGIRASNPDITWGEKAMDASFVNAAYQNETFPAADPWYAGKPANYYYYGHLIVGIFGRWVGVSPDCAYNLAASTWPALVFILVFSIVYNIKGSRLGGLIAAFLATMAGSVKSVIQLAANLHLPNSPDDPMSYRADYIPHDGILGCLKDDWTQLWGAISLAPTVLAKAWLAFKASFGGESLQFASEQGLNRLFGFDDYFWKLSRIIKSSVACEFPAWSATFADLHAHLLIMPIGMLTLSLMVAYCLRKSERWRLLADGYQEAAFLQTGGIYVTVSQIATIGLLLGVVAITNTWDLPGLSGFFLISSILLFVFHGHDFFKAFKWRMGRSILSLGLWGRRIKRFAWWKFGVLQEIVLPFVFVYLLSRVFFFPFHQSFTTPERVKGIGWMHIAGSGWTTPYEFIQIFGVFFMIFTVGIVMTYWRWIGNTRGAASKALVWLPVSAVLSFSFAYLMRKLALKTFDPSMLASMPSKSGDDIIFWKYLDSDIAYLVCGFVLFVLLSLTPFLFRRGANMYDRLGALIFALGLAIVCGCEVVYIIEGWSPPSHRWNTVFKFHLQAWLCFSIACGWLIGHWRMRGISYAGFFGRVTGRFSRYAIGYPLIVAALLLGAVFPLAAPYLFGYANGLEGRTRQIPGVKTVDGLNFMREKEPDVAAGIDWLRANIKGAPVVVEAAGESYIDTRSRFSTHTGLPTLIGWVHHSRERGNLPEPRIEDCRMLYTSTQREKVRDLLRRESVRYVVVGPTERSLYSLAGGKGIRKFEEWGDLFYPVFESRIKPPGVTIYQVNPSYQLTAADLPQATKTEELFTKDEGLALLRGAEGFGAGQYREPRAIVRSAKGQVYVADTQNHRIQSFDAQTNFLWLLGEKGEEPGYFKEPNDLAFDEETGGLVVCDTWNGRVQIFSATGAVSQAFPVDAFGPRGIAIGRAPIASASGDAFFLGAAPELSDKLIFIANTGGKTIQVLSMEGRKLNEFGSSGTEQGILGEPVDVEITPMGLAVTDARNQRIAFYDGRGRFLREWKIPTESTGGTTNEMHLSYHPEKKQMAVSDPEHDRVFVLGENGELVSEIKVPGNPTGICWTGDGRLYATVRGRHRIVMLSL